MVSGVYVYVGVDVKVTETVCAGVKVAVIVMLCDGVAVRVMVMDGVFVADTV